MGAKEAFDRSRWERLLFSCFSYEIALYKTGKICYTK